MMIPRKDGQEISEVLNLRRFGSSRFDVCALVWNTKVVFLTIVRALWTVLSSVSVVMFSPMFLLICIYPVFIFVSSLSVLCCTFVALIHSITLHMLAFWFGLLGVVVHC